MPRELKCCAGVQPMSADWTVVSCHQSCSRTSRAPRARTKRAKPSGTSHVARFVRARSEEHTSELQSRPHLVCRLLLEKKKTNYTPSYSTHPNSDMADSQVNLVSYPSMNTEKAGDRNSWTISRPPQTRPRRTTLPLKNV